MIVLVAFMISMIKRTDRPNPGDFVNVELELVGVLDYIKFYLLLYGTFTQFIK